jgi:hypothetical protein
VPGIAGFGKKAQVGKLKLFDKPGADSTVCCCGLLALAGVCCQQQKQRQVKAGNEYKNTGLAHGRFHLYQNFSLKSFVQSKRAPKSQGVILNGAKRSEESL